MSFLEDKYGGEVNSRRGLGEWEGVLSKAEKVTPEQTPEGGRRWPRGCLGQEGVGQEQPAEAQRWGGHRRQRDRKAVQPVPSEQSQRAGEGRPWPCQLQEDFGVIVPCSFHNSSAGP